MVLLEIDGVEEVVLPPWQPVSEALGAGVTDLPLPDGLGYGGADTWSAQDASGAIYAVLCAERPSQKFGTYAFRRHPNGHREYIALQEFTEGRVTVSEEPPVGAFLTWLARGDRVLKRAQLPGFVPLLATGVATPITVVPTAPATGGGAGGPAVDEVARKYTSDTKKALEAQLRAQEARIKALEARVSDSSLMHVVWKVMGEKLEDGLYLILSSNTGGVVGQVQRIAAETAKAMRGRGEI